MKLLLIQGMLMVLFLSFNGMEFTENVTVPALPGAREFGCSGDNIFLKSNHGTYVVAGKDGTAKANGDRADDGAKFSVIDLGSSKIGLLSSHGRYLVAEWNKNVNANRGRLGEWEKFVVKYQGGVKIALKTHHGDYVVAKPNGSLRADVRVVGPWAIFTPECVDEL